MYIHIVFNIALFVFPISHQSKCYKVLFIQIIRFADGLCMLLKSVEVYPIFNIIVYPCTKCYAICTLDFGYWYIFVF